MENSQLEHKLTAEQIEHDCPAKLEELGRRIATHLQKAHTYEKKACECDEKADQHITSAAKYLAEAKEACNDGGFAAFHEKYCPDLGKTRVNDLLQIGTGKKTVNEIRASIRERVAKHRANKKIKATESERPEAELASDSVTVTDKTELTPPPPEGVTMASPIHPSSTVADQATESATVRRAVNSGNDRVSCFTAIFLELKRKIDKRSPEYFVRTGVSADDLATAGKFLLELATLKQSAPKATKRLVPQGNGLVSTEESAEAMRAAHAANDARADAAERASRPDEHPQSSIE
jgi:hypothetical protein